MSTKPSSTGLAKSAGTIGALTGLSRVLGFVRDMIIASAFGTGLGAEAFVVSFRIPNLLRDLVGEGATNSAFVPVLSECRQKDPAHFWALVSRLFWVLSAVLALLTVLGIVFAPQIVSWIAPGFAHASDPNKFPLTVQLTRVIFPYIFLIGLSALAMGVLNALREFTSSAAGPALLNICMILSGVFFEKYFGPMALVVAVLLGGVLQLAWQMGPLLKRGFRLTLESPGGAYAQKIWKLLLPRALGSAVYQINVFVDSVLASFESIVGVGAQSALYYANRLFQLPLAIFGVALAQAILPVFSVQHLRQNHAEFRRTLAGALGSMFFVIAPASAGLLIFSKPIVRILFQRGEFNEWSAHLTSSALFFYAFGLLSCCLIKILVNAFYAMQDTRTPVKTMGVSVALNIALSLTLMGPLKIGGLALASSVSATVNVVLLYMILRRRIGSIGGRILVGSFSKVLLATLVMSVLAVFLDRGLLRPWSHASGTAQSLCLSLTIAACMLCYFGTCLALRVKEAKKMWEWRC